MILQDLTAERATLLGGLQPSENDDFARISQIDKIRAGLNISSAYNHGQITKTSNQKQFMPFDNLSGKSGTFLSPPFYRTEKSLEAQTAEGPSRVSKIAFLMKLECI